MELDSVLKLINAVSDSSLTSFTLDDGNTKLSFAADRAEVIKNNEFSIVRNTKEEQNSSYAVSYTHLTLPTTSRV